MVSIPELTFRGSLTYRDTSLLVALPLLAALCFQELILEDRKRIRIAAALWV